MSAITPNPSTTVILQQPPDGLAARSFDLSDGDVTVKVQGWIAVASPNPITVTWGANQVLTSWFDVLARPRLVRFVGDLIVSGFGIVTIWNGAAVQGTPYTPPINMNYTSTSWSIESGSNIVSATALGGSPNISVSNGASVSFLNADQLSVQGNVNATGNIGAINVSATNGQFTVVDTATIVNGVAGTPPGVFVNDQLRVGNTLTLNGPIVSTSATASSFAAAVTAPTFNGSLSGNADTATGANYLLGTAVVPSGYTQVTYSYGVAFDPSSNQIALVFQYGGTDYYATLGGVTPV